MDQPGGNATQLSPSTMAARKQISSDVDASEPTKPISAYGLFFRDTVTAIKQEHPSSTFQELSTIVASMWESLEDSLRDTYIKKHEAAMSEYMHQLKMHRQQQEEQQPKKQKVGMQMEHNNSKNTTALQSKPAIFTIQHSTTQQQSLVDNQEGTQAQAPNLQTNNTSSTNNAIASNNLTSQQKQTLSAGTAVQLCIRENCNKPAVVNPDWEDEYCSNECVVMHCRNVFNSWVQSNRELT